MKITLTTQIILLLVIGIIIRVTYLNRLPTLFFFDQARDLLAVREIVEDKKIKVQGPSASGTNDTIYHGVLYYYFLAPLYLITQGNPKNIQLLLGILLSSSLVPVFFLSLKLSRSKSAALVASIMYIFSVDSAIHGSWLSNPSLATLTVPTYLLTLWLVFFEGKTKWLWLTGLSLALSIQSVIFAGYLFGMFFLLLFLNSICDKQFIKKSQTKHWLFFIIFLLIGLSSMIVAQWRLYQAGIFKLSNLSNTLGTSSSFFQTISQIHISYTEKLRFLLTTESRSMVVFVFCLAIGLFFRKIWLKQKIFYLASFVSPFFLLLFLSKDSLHTVVGLEVIFILPFAFVISQLIDNIRPVVKMTGTLFLLIFIFLQITFLNKLSINRQYPPAVQPGMYLDDQIRLIDYVYRSSKGEEFSFSTLGNPYRYATTWIYLFSWYGQAEYGYMPVIAKQNQIGMYGEKILSQTDQHSHYHFAIFEPNLNIDEYFRKIFSQEQSQDGNQLIEQKKFGEIIVQYWGRES